MKKLIFTQFILFSLGIIDLLGILSDLGGTTGCRPWAYVFYIRILLFLFSLLVSYALHRKGIKRYKWIVYVPIIFVANSIFAVAFYQLQWTRIYEQWVGGAKTWKTFAEPGKPCSTFFMNLFESSKEFKYENYKEMPKIIQWIKEFFDGMRSVIY